jgi:hypothetical protein
MTRPSVPVETLQQLQKHVPSIVKNINADPALALAAAVNPLLALEELGYQIPGPLRQTVEHRIRFSLEQFKRLEELSAEIHLAFGQQFDIESASELSEVLRREMKLQEGQRVPSNLSMQPQLKWTERQEEPLEQFRDAHPAMKAILEYRQIEASEPRLGSRELYDQIRQGTIPLPAKTVVFQLKKGPASK